MQKGDRRPRETRSRRKRGPEPALGRTQASSMHSKGGEGPDLAQRALLLSLAPGAWPRSNQVLLGLKPSVSAAKAGPFSSLGEHGGRAGEHAFRVELWWCCHLPCPRAMSCCDKTSQVIGGAWHEGGVFGQSGAPSTTLPWRKPAANRSGCCPFSKGNGASTLPAMAGCSPFLPDS